MVVSKKKAGPKKKAEPAKKKAAAPAKKASLSQQKAAAKTVAPAKKAAPEKKASKKKTPAKKAAAAKKVRLLAGGNPQIKKGDGDAPVQAYLAALSGWKGDAARWVDELIVRTLPKVKKAVKWNSPFYGMEGQGWFLSLHVFKSYVKLLFFRGAMLKPMPPVPSAQKEARYFEIREGDPRAEAELERWLKQAAALPGWLA